MSITEIVLRNLRLLAAPVAAFLLAGCAAGSMLVEVEVYKGPLGKTKTVQTGELFAVVDKSISLIEGFHGSFQQTRRELGCGDKLALVECHHIDAMEFNANELARNLRKVQDTAQERRSMLLRRTNPAETQGIIVEATRVATQLKIESFFWAESQIARVSTRQRFRALLVDFINLTSELSNQIASRTDVLAKQARENEHGAEEEDRSIKGTDLALSDHLKDAGPTDFLYLYDWYGATDPDDGLSSGPQRLTARDRARLARRLFADHYWTKINEVHGSAQGEFRMALVKDSIGNWNLKSFDADPEQLLDAYRRVTLAGIKGAVSIARKSTGADRLDIVSQFARGRLGTGNAIAADESRLKSLRQRVRDDLTTIHAKAQGEEAGKLAAREAKTRETWEGARRDLLDRQGKHRAAAAGRAARAEELSIARRQERADAVQRLETELDEAHIREDSAHDDLTAAETAEAKARAELDDARRAYRSYMADLVAEARRSIEVHQRVIDGLKSMH